MVIASPYAVFKAAERAWPPASSTALAQKRAPATATSRPPHAAWSQVIQGELFQLS